MRKRVDRIIEVSQGDAEDTMRRLAREEGIFAGVSSGGALWAALELSKEVENAVIVTIVCDRGDRYLSTGIFGCQRAQIAPPLPLRESAGVRGTLIRHGPALGRAPQVRQQRFALEHELLGQRRTASRTAPRAAAAHAIQASRSTAISSL